MVPMWKHLRARRAFPRRPLFDVSGRAVLRRRPNLSVRALGFGLDLKCLDGITFGLGFGDNFEFCILSFELCNPPGCLARKEGPLPTAPSSASPRLLSNYSCQRRENQLSERRKVEKGRVKLGPNGRDSGRSAGSWPHPYGDTTR